MPVHSLTESRSRGRFLTPALVALLVALSAIPVVALWRAFGPTVIVAPDFVLTDQNGHALRLSDLRGQPVVIIFGYTHCPDVCPTTLAHLARALHAPTTAVDERVVFITVDPDRDSPRVLNRYVKLFDPSFIGLTGDLRKLQPVYAAYHMWRQAVPANHGSDDYSIVHGTTLYYVGRDGTMKGFGSWEDDTAALAQDLKRFQ